MRELARQLAPVALIAALAAPLCAQATRPWRLGALQWQESPNHQAPLEGRQAALREAGRPHELLLRQALSDRERARAALLDLRAQAVDLIIALGTEAALVASEVEHEIPIVFTAVTDPVATGVVASWQGSGRNLAGNSNWIAPEISLHVFTLAVPALKRLGILRSTKTGKVSAAELEAMRRRLAQPNAPAIEIVAAQVESEIELGDATQRLIDAGVQAVWVPIDFLVYEHLPPILAVTQAHHIPIVSSSLGAARSGAVAGIVRDYRLLGAQAAAITLDILEQHRDPGTLEVGTMHSYEVVVNMGAARRARYELPLALLAAADQILEAEPEATHGR
ncbi:MAG: ABC transporter substrate-binding protein [Planctomycetota bacterium]